MTTHLLQEFPELTHYSRQELEDMLIDPAYFQAVFHSLDQVKAMYRSLTELGMANEAIAKLQDSLYLLRSETKDAFDESKRLEARWKEVEKEQREVYQRFSPQFLHMRLRHSITSQDDKSEAVATEFVHHQSPATVSSATGTVNNNGPNIDNFIKEYKELRKVYHKRAIWNEKWNHGQVEWRDD